MLGISPDGPSSHEKFASKFNLTFPLLCDEDHSVCQQYGVWVEKTRFGKKSFGVQRATFLILADGTIGRVWPKVQVNGHVQDVAQEVAALRG